MESQPTIGSDLYVRRPGWFSELVAWSTKGRRELKTLATHQAKFLTPSVVSHATAGGVVNNAWPAYRAFLEEDRAEWCILNREPMASPTEASAIDACLWDMHGWPYSPLELVLQFFDGMIAKVWREERVGLDVVVFRRLGRMWERGVICSKTANLADRKVGWIPPGYEFAAPDDSWDVKVNSSPANPLCGGWWYVAQCSPGWWR